MTPAPHSQTSERYLMALYYAYGRNDSIQSQLDPIKFAEHYMSLFTDFTNGEASHMPSVQDAWDHYRRMVAA